MNSKYIVRKSYPVALQALSILRLFHNLFHPFFL